MRSRPDNPLGPLYDRHTALLHPDDAKNYLWEVCREAEVVDDCYHNRFVPAAIQWIEASGGGATTGPQIIDREHSQRDMLAAMEGILSGYARISLFFFPEGRSKAFGVARAAQLRNLVAVDVSHPIGNRKLRNHWMHLDERLDAEVRAGRDVPLGWLIGSRHKIPVKLFATTFRLIDPAAEIVYILGTAFPLRELVDAVDHISGQAASAIVGAKSTP